MTWYKQPRAKHLGQMRLFQVPGLASARQQKPVPLRTSRLLTRLLMLHSRLPMNVTELQPRPTLSRLGRRLLMATAVTISQRLKVARPQEVPFVSETLRWLCRSNETLTRALLLPLAMNGTILRSEHPDKLTTLDSGLKVVRVPTVGSPRDQAKTCSTIHLLWSGVRLPVSSTATTAPPRKAGVCLLSWML